MSATNAIPAIDDVGSYEFYLVDAASLCMLHVSEPATRQLRCRTDELIGKPLAIVGDAYTIEKLATIPYGPTYSIATQHTRRDGTRYAVDVCIRRFDHDRRSCFLLIVMRRGPDHPAPRAAQLEVITVAPGELRSFQARGLSRQASRSQSHLH